MMDAAIVIEGLTKSFENVTALDGLSFEVEKGELFGPWGQTGPGRPRR